MKEDDGLTPEKKKRRKYELEKRGKVMIRVQLSGSDGDAEEEQWAKIRDGLRSKYGSAKQGIFELAKRDKIIE